MPAQQPRQRASAARTTSLVLLLLAAAANGSTHSRKLSSTPTATPATTSASAAAPATPGPSLALPSAARLHDRSWDFRDVASRLHAHAQFAAQGGVGYEHDGVTESEGGVKLLSMFRDWCLTFSAQCDGSKSHLRNFKASMKRVHTVNSDPTATWWASGNEYSHLDEASLLATHTGYLPPSGPAADAAVTASAQVTAGTDTTVDDETTAGSPAPSTSSASNAITRSSRKLASRPAKPAPSPARGLVVTAPVPAPLAAPVPVSSTAVGGACVFLDNNHLQVQPAPQASTCMQCFQQCVAAAMCYFYSWGDSQVVSYNGPTSLYPCTMPSPPVPQPRPPIPPPQDTINWAAKGMVTKVRYQGSCGSCWAHVAVAAMETHYLQAGMGSAATLDLAEQQLVSCNLGGSCQGGNTYMAMTAFANTPLDKESLWPYTGSSGNCTASRVANATSGNAVRLSGSPTYVQADSEGAMKQALQTGPVTVVWTADAAFGVYAGGVFKSSTCGGAVNHAMLVVGWDYDAASNQNYFLLKNSWGTGWGESGFVRVAMIGDGRGMCGLYTYSYQIKGTFTSTPLSAPFSR